jgi:hypothetical protein
LIAQHSQQRRRSWLPFLLPRTEDRLGWFLPTTLLRLLITLRDKRPCHRLIAADFDALPDVRIAGLNAPLVASQQAGGYTLDHESYLLPPGLAADVLFPTDFGLLSALAGGGRAEQTAAFLKRYLTSEELHRCTTASGFNPLMHEFPNTQVWLTA